MPASPESEPVRRKLLEQVRAAIQAQHFSPRTEEAYAGRCVCISMLARVRIAVRNVQLLVWPAAYPHWRYAASAEVTPGLSPFLLT